MVLQYGNFTIERPEFLLLILPLMALLFFLLKWKLFKVSTNLKKRRLYRFFMFMSKLLIFSLLVISISSPSLEEREYIDQLPSLKVIVDNSSSMKIFDTDDINRFLDGFDEQDIIIEKSMINSEEISGIGNAVLKKLEPEKNLLLISDGWSNSGTDLQDISVLAANMNAKIFGLDIEPDNSDTAVFIEGPDKVLANVEASFSVHLKRVNTESAKRLKISVDDEIIYDESTMDDEIPVNMSFEDGEHTIVAEIDTDDTLPENNVFYKTIHVVEKPTLLLISERETELEEILKSLYFVEKADEIPAELDKYFAIILDNMNSRDLEEEDVERLEEFLEHENGLLVIGGRDSYEYGGYKTSRLNRLLPVDIGEAKKKKDTVNIIIAIDTGTSGGIEIESSTSDGEVHFIDVQKALAVDVVDTISGASKVGVIESNIFPSIISSLSLLGPKKTELKDRISRIKLHDSTKIYESLLVAKELLRLESGSKNVILITDGNAAINWDDEVSRTPTYDQVQSLNNVEQLVSEGIKVFVVGVGQRADTEFLEELATRGGGRYFQADQRNRLNIFFGDNSDIPTDEDIKMFIYDTNHFITEDSEPDVEVLGYNVVFPKTNARLLATTTTADPLLTIWRYGLGRVAALTTDPETWAGQLLKKKNSPLMIKTVNWLVENPERKNDVIIDFPDFEVNQNNIITVKSEEMPNSDTLMFFEEQKNIFTAYYYPTKPGIDTMLSRKIAINYNDEYRNLGINPELEKTLSVSSGKILQMDREAIVSEIKSSTTGESVKNVDLSWYFVLAGLVFYLLEVILRKIYEIKMSKIDY